MTDTLSLQFSDFDMPDTFAPAPQVEHHVFPFKTDRSVRADCVCGASKESWGLDESSSRSIGTWIKEHEAGQ